MAMAMRRTEGGQRSHCMNGGGPVSVIGMGAGGPARALLTDDFLDDPPSAGNRRTAAAAGRERIITPHLACLPLVKRPPWPRLFYCDAIANLSLLEQADRGLFAGSGRLRLDNSPSGPDSRVHCTVLQLLSASTRSATRRELPVSTLPSNRELTIKSAGSIWVFEGRFFRWWCVESQGSGIRWVDVVRRGFLCGGVREGLINRSVWVERTENNGERKGLYVR